MRNLIRWLFSSKTLVFIFGAIAGVMGTCFSVLIRMELARPGDQILGGNHQLYNVLMGSFFFFVVGSIIILIINFIQFLKHFKEIGSLVFERRAGFP